MSRCDPLRHLDVTPCARTNLIHGSWQPWTNRYGTGAEIIFEPATDESGRYFRYIIQLPE
ncbi:MAG: hypothetical protein ACNA71_10680 [Kiritimatiellia bacterium]